VRVSASKKRTTRAFNLLEVMVAVAIFFMCIFSILALVSRSLKAARSLQPLQVDARAAISFLSLTNRLEEGPLPPEVVMAFERENPGYTVAGQIYEVATNGLFRVDFTVGGASSGEHKVAVTSDSSILLFRPLSASTRPGGVTGLRR
jgi:Tfp pilus assembly protein PilV